MVGQAGLGQCPELMPPDVLTSLVLPPTQVDVWLVPAVADGAEVEKIAGNWLSDDERARLDGRRLPKGRAMFLLTRAVLRRLLSAYCPDVHPKDWQLGRSAEGRPCVQGPVPAPFFNLSHTDDALVLAFASNGEPGVDIEHLDRQLDAGALAQRYFSTAECRSLMCLPASQQRDRFLRLWTLKEACVKANGQGLAQALRHFEFAFADSGSLMFYPTPLESPPNCYWRLWSITLSELRIALAVRCQSDPGMCQYRLRQLQWPDQVSTITREADYTGAL
jgi:4'-phosphopantetheinyl transferase